MTDRCNLCPACRTEVERWFVELDNRMPKATTTEVFVLWLFAVMKSTMLATDDSFLPDGLRQDLTRLDELKERILAEEKARR